jgi:excisionase family DNA binding protein
MVCHMTALLPDTEAYITPAEIARHLRLSRMTVYRLLHEGEIKSVRVGRSIRVLRTVFDAYMAGRAA